jgi:hypothetical protein
MDIAKQAQKQRGRVRLPDELAPGRLARRGAPAVIALAVVFAYRLILFWLPLIVGGIAFVSLRQNLDSLRTASRDNR